MFSKKTHVAFLKTIRRYNFIVLPAEIFHIYFFKKTAFGIRIVRHQLDDTEMVVGSLFDFEYRGRGCVLHTDTDMEDPRMQVKSVLTNAQHVIHAPVFQTEGGDMVFKSIDL